MTWVALAVVLLVAPLPVLAGEGLEAFHPGYEADVLKLISPYDEDSLDIHGWGLDGISIGPGCELHLQMVRHADGASLDVRIIPASPDGQSGFAYWYADGESPRSPPADLQTALEALIDGNDPGGFFTERCGPLVIGAEPEEPSSRERNTGTPWLVLFRLFLCVAAAAFALWLLSGSGTRDVTKKTGRREWIAVGLMLLVGMGLRLFMVQGAPIGPHETDSLTMLEFNDLLVSLGLGTPLPGGHEEWGFHMPLHIDSP